MAFTFPPKTEQEVANVFPRGDYRFKVINSESKYDKNGNPMLYLKIRVFHNDIPGKTNLVNVYLTNNPNFEFLIRHFAYSIGLGDSYEKGILEPSQCMDKGGIVRLGISVDNNKQYPDKNNAVDFLVDKETNAEQKSTIPPDLDEDVPF